MPDRGMAPGVLIHASSRIETPPVLEYKAESWGGSSVWR